MKEVLKSKITSTRIIIGSLVLIAFIAGILYIWQMMNQSNSNKKASAEPPMEITLGIWDAKTKLAGDPLLDQVEKKLNIKIVPVNVTYMNWTEEFQKMAASDTLPDIISSDIIESATYSTWIRQKLIRKIPEDLSKYPLLQKYVNLPYNDYFRDEKGELYCIPRITYEKEESWALDRCILVRTDWMEKLGISMPQNFEEFENMLYRFVHDDPDGNGVDDTVGLSIGNMNLFEAIYLSIFPELSNVERGWIKEDGQWMPVYCSKRTGKALSYAKRLYDKGLLDSNFAYQNNRDAHKNFARGKSGAIASQYLSVAGIWNQYNPGTDFTKVAKIMHPWPAPDHNTYRFTTSLHWSETYISGHVNDKKLAKICELYNYLLSDEFDQLMAKYTLDKCPSMDILSTLVRWNQDKDFLNQGRARNQYTKEELDYAGKELEWYKKNTVRVNYNWDIVFMNSNEKNQLPSYQEIQNEMVKVIIGKDDPETAWNKALEKLRSETTIDKAIEEVTAKAKEMGE